MSIASDDSMMLSAGRHTIHVGDCLVLLAGQADASVDVVVTSPPYNIGIAYRSYDDQRPRVDYLDWLDRIAINLRRVMKPSASLFLNVGNTAKDPWIENDVSGVFRRHFTLQNRISWVKSISIGDETVGHFKPINSTRFLNGTHEAIFHFTKTGTVPLDRLAVGVPFMDKSNIRRRGHAGDRRCAGNAWFIPYPTVQSGNAKFHHPASFPPALPMRCLRLHGGSSLVVLDPFLGTGTTLVAAERLGHIGIGMELDAGYAANAAERVRQESDFIARTAAAEAEAT